MRRQVPARPGWLALCLACLLVNGCSKESKIAPVHGRVTYDGKPVHAGAKITFFPEHGRPSAAAIGEDGTYTLTYLSPGDGALIGLHKVAIQATKVGPASYVDPPKSVEEEVAQAKKRPPPGKIQLAGKIDWLVPQKYSRQETTPLTATVEDKDNEINFEIPK